MKFRKSQAALEFLTTYSWAFLVILLSIAALYYFGIFDVDSYLPQKCIFTTQFQCDDFALLSDQGEIRLKLINNIGEDINITGWSITNDWETPVSCTVPGPSADPEAWEAGTEKDFTFTNCADGGFLKDERINVDLTMTYYAIITPSHPLHQVKGKIIGKVG